MPLSALEPKYGKRTRTVYDAVAGRVRVHPQDKAHTSIDDGLRAAVAPDDLLLDMSCIKGTGLPVPVLDHPDLPSTDLLTAIHFYASDYFKRMGRLEGLGAFDESALLAMGVALEEAIKEAVGPNGHLVFAQDKATDFLRSDSDDIADDVPSDTNASPLNMVDLHDTATDSSSDS